MTTRIRALIVFCLLNSPIFISNALAVDSEYYGNWYLGAGAGRSLYSMNNDNYINPGVGWVVDHYYKNTIHDGDFIEANAGYAWTRYNDWFPIISLGVRYDYAFNGKVSGYIEQYSLGQFKNYTYSYNYSRQNILGLVKLDLFRANGFMPFIVAGTGGSYNKAGSYTELPLANVTPRISPAYGTDFNWNWSYIVGVGVDYQFRDDMWVTVEYNYGDFGNVNTDNGQLTDSLTGIDYSGQHLRNSLKANSFSLGFTYLLNYV